MPRLLFALCAAALVACADLPFSPVHDTLPLELARTSVTRHPEAPGSEYLVATVAFELTNDGATAIVVSGCDQPDGSGWMLVPHVDRWNEREGKWEADHFPICRWSKSTELAPRASVRDSVRLPQPGTYRLRIPHLVSRTGTSDRTSITSAAFRVR